MLCNKPNEKTLDNNIFFHWLLEQELKYATHELHLMWKISWIANLDSFAKTLNQLSFGFFFYLILQWTILIGPSQKNI
jgi:hypothetical protein